MGQKGLLFKAKSRGEEGAKEENPRGHRGGSPEEAHTLIRHVLVCLGAQKSAPVTRSNPGDSSVHCRCCDV